MSSRRTRWSSEPLDTTVRSESNRPVSVRSYSSNSEKAQNESCTTVFHKCIVCQIGFKQRKPKILYPSIGKKKLSNSSKILDEFSIAFVLCECLGISDESGQTIFTDLLDRFGEPGNWGVSFCDKHSAIVERANEIYRLIKTLERGLADLKKDLQTDLLDSFKVDMGLDQCKGFNAIREALKNALCIPEEVKQETDVTAGNLPVVQEFVWENAIDPSVEVKEEVEEELLLFSEPEVPDIYKNLDDADWPRKTKRKTVKPKSLKSLKKKTSKAKKLVVKAKAGQKIHIFKCGYCPQQFNNAPDRSAHRKSDHGPDAKKPFECNLCSEAFLYEHSLKGHQLKVHQPERPFQCDQCSKSYAIGADLRKHQKRTHSAMANEIVTCPTCNKTYKGQINLRKHMKLHNDKERAKKTFICELCSKTYTSSQMLKTHQAKEHKMSPYEPSVCEICQKTLSDSKSLRKHMKSQHLKKFDYTCHICGSMSLFKSHLDAHMKSAHNNSSSSSTNKSKSSAKTKSSKQSQEDPNTQKINDGSYPYECYSCQEEFDSKSLLENHRWKGCAQFAYL